MKNIRVLGTQKGTNLASAAMIFHIWVSRIDVATESSIFTTSRANVTMTSPTLQKQTQSPSWVSQISAINWAMVQSKELQLYNS